MLRLVLPLLLFLPAVLVQANPVPSKRACAYECPASTSRGQSLEDQDYEADEKKLVCQYEDLAKDCNYSIITGFPSLLNAASCPSQAVQQCGRRQRPLHSRSEEEERVWSRQAKIGEFENGGRYVEARSVSST